VFHVKSDRFMLHHPMPRPLNNRYLLRRVHISQHRPILDTFHVQPNNAQVLDGMQSKRNGIDALHTVQSKLFSNIQVLHAVLPNELHPRSDVQSNRHRISLFRIRSNKLQLQPNRHALLILPNEFHQRGNVKSN